MKRKHEARLMHKAVCVTSALAVATLMSAPLASADTAALWTVPTEAVSADDNIVTVGSHSTATSTAEILGLNGTSITAKLLTASSLDEAQNTDQLGVWASDANQNPNPLLKNKFYNYYANENGLEASADIAATDTSGTYPAYNFNAIIESEYGTCADLYLRPDIVLGIGGAVGNAANTDSLRFNHDTTTSINYASWGTGLSIPTQSYAFVLALRNRTNDESLVGTTSSDGNTFTYSEYSKEGDIGYDPVGVMYNESSTTESGYDYQIGNVASLARAAKRVMAQQGKTTRYDDPVDIAYKYEQFVNATKWYVLEKIAAGEVSKKKVAVVANVTPDNAFNLVKLDADTATSSSLGTMATAAAAEDTVTDLAASLFPSASTGLVSKTVTAADLMSADVVICLPPLIKSYNSTAADVIAALEAADYTDASAYPTIINNAMPNGTFETANSFAGSSESALLVGLVQGAIYPELINATDAATYFAKELLHLTDDAASAYVANELSGLNLADGTDSAVANIQTILDEGTEWYLKNKSGVNKTNPRIASSSLFNYLNGVGTTTVSITVPDGATLVVYDGYGMPLAANSDGSYTVLSSDTAIEAVVSMEGYDTYTKTLSASDGTVEITETDIAGTQDSEEPAVEPDDGSQDVTPTLKSQSLKIAKAQLTKTVKYKKVKKKAVTTSKVKVTGAKTTVTYKRVSGNKKLSIVKKTGKIKVKKGTKKGTYKIKVKATAKKTSTYKAASITKVVKVKVK